MKKARTTIGLLLVIFVTGSMLSYAAITGSGHDLSSEAWNTTGEICIVCHTPHNAVAVTGAPLWNHSTSTATYTMYSSSSMHGTVASSPTANSSKLCMSCHDGTVALDAFGGASGNAANKMTGSRNLGSDLSNDHPISVTWAGTAAGLNDSSTTVTSLSGTINQTMLKSGKVECASCHDVHNAKGISHLLLIDNSNKSALCLTCHNK